MQFSFVFKNFPKVLEVSLLEAIVTQGFITVAFNPNSFGLYKHFDPQKIKTEKTDE